LNANDFELIISDTWKSRRSNARYPARWRLQVASFAIDLVIVSNLPDQEMRTFNTTGVTYWEGSVAIYGSKNGRPVEGQGYVELTGYAEAFDAPL
jgi:predicted secreted hydrolase